MTSIWFPNNKYPPNTKNYLPCFVLGGGLVLGGRDYGKSPFSMAKSTISMAIFNSELFIYQRLFGNYEPTN